MGYNKTTFYKDEYYTNIFLKMIKNGLSFNLVVIVTEITNKLIGIKISIKQSLFMASCSQIDLKAHIQTKAW